MFLAIPPILLQILIATGLAGILCVIAFYKKWLDAGGAIAATIMGAVIWLAGGWFTTLPMLFFFVSGSIFSKLPNKKQTITDAKQSKARDYIQVLCNGGIASVCLLFWIIYQESFWLLAYCASLSISTCDTWSSELGVRFGGKVVDIIGFKALPAGISGGVSAFGSLAGLVGSVLMAILCCVMFHLPFVEALIIAAAGFAGMLLDSLLGSRLQARYRMNNGNQAEFLLQKKDGRLEKGLVWMNNDAVNILSNFLVTALAILLLNSCC